MDGYVIFLDRRKLGVIGWVELRIYVLYLLSLKICDI